MPHRARADNSLLPESLSNRKQPRNMFDARNLIAAVFYKGILLLNMAF
jgi:hypothetical protein